MAYNLQFSKIVVQYQAITQASVHHTPIKPNKHPLGIFSKDRAYSSYSEFLGRYSSSFLAKNMVVISLLYWNTNRHAINNQASCLQITH